MKSKKVRQLTVSVDFDGTITRSSDPNSADFNRIKDFCHSTIVDLSKKGVKFILLTGRRPEWVKEAVQLCKKWGLPIDTSTPNTKRISDVYIDDRNLGCTGIDWQVIYSMLNDKLIASQNKYLVE